MSYYLEGGDITSSAEYKQILGEMRKLTLAKMIDYAIDSDKFDDLLKDAIQELVKEKLGDLTADGSLLVDSGGVAIDEEKLSKVVSESVSKSIPSGDSLSALDDKVGQTVASVEELTTKLTDLEASIGKMGGAELSSVNEGVQSILEKLDSIVTDIQSAQPPEDTGIIKKGIGALLLKLDKVLEDGKLTDEELKSLKTTITDTKKSPKVNLVSKLNKIQSSTITAVDRLKNINTTSYKVLNRSSILEQKILRLGESIESLRKATTNLNKSLKEVPGAEELKADLSTKVNSIKAGFKSLPYVVSKVKTLSEEMYNIKDLVDDTSRVSLEKYSTIMDNVYDMNKKVDKIVALEDKIKRINQKTFQLQAPY
jgi:hypothetical protein